MLPTIVQSIRRLAPAALAVALIFGALPGCTAGPTLPVPPPAALVSSPDADGMVTIEIIALRPGALVFAYNENTEQGVIRTAPESGMLNIRIPASIGDAITVWQMQGSSSSSLVELVVRP